MKRSILFSICLIAAIGSRAQEATNDFLIIGNHLVWQKIYTSDITEEDIAELLFNSGDFADIGNAGGMITCRIPATPIDFAGAGFKRGVTAGYILLNDLTAFVRIQVKDGRYRVTVDKLELIATSDTVLGASGERISLDYYGIKRGAFSSSFYKYINPIIGKQLDDLFSFQNDIMLDEDW